MFITRFLFKSSCPYLHFLVVCEQNCGAAILAAAAPFLGSFSGNARQNAGLPKCFSDDVLVAMEQDWFEENAAVPSLRSYGIVRWSAARWRSLLKRGAKN